jgi:ketosteroid isomerase-like protein
MTKQFLIALSVLIFACLNVATVRAQDDAEVRKALDAQYRQLAAAHNRNDLKAIVALKTADFHAIFPDGRVADSKVMEEYSRQFLAGNQPPYDIRFSIEKLNVSENKLIAVAEVLQEVGRTRDFDGTRRKVETSVRQRETWTMTPGGWKLKSVDNVRDQKRFVDGKRVDPTKRYNPADPPYDPDAGPKKP